jgi:preprotein translocase subunit SecG
MYPFVVALHVVLCAFLILIIMLQPGKGGDVGAAFGSGLTTSVFGPRGPTGLLQRATTVVAVIFMGTSITLAIYSSQKMRSNTDVEGALQQLQQQEDDEKKQQEKEAPPPAPENEAPAPAPVDGGGATN